MTETSQRPRVVANASTLVLLTKADLIEQLLNRSSVMIPEEVYDEAVTAGKEKGAADAFAIELLVKNGRIGVQDVSEEQKQRLYELFNLKAGEQATVALARSEGINNVLSDDKKAINACRALDIAFATALDIVVQFRQDGTISEDAARQVIQKLDQFGWYGPDLIASALGDIDASGSSE